MKVKITNKEDLINYLTNNIKTFFNAEYVNNSIIFDEQNFFYITIE